MVEDLSGIRNPERQDSVQDLVLRGARIAMEIGQHIKIVSEEPLTLISVLADEGSLFAQVATKEDGVSFHRMGFLNYNPSIPTQYTESRDRIVTRSESKQTIALPLISTLLADIEATI